jgi:hypothetical protein
MRLRAAPATTAAAVLIALALAAAMGRLAPPPSAEVARGGETAFARGLHRREIVPGLGPQRWTAPRARFLFRDVPSGAAELTVRLRGHRTTVVVGVDGVVIGTLEPGRASLVSSLASLRAGDHEVELRTEGFQAPDGRILGALLDGVTLRPAPRAIPSARLLLLFALPAALLALAALASGLTPASAIAAAAQGSIAEAMLLWPQGLVRSSYAGWLAALIVIGALGAVLFARWRDARVPGVGPWAFAAFLAAFLVQVLAATSPLMVVSDEVFHANNLARVAGGEWFLTSVTQHAQPFRFPYGVSFYALLAPLLRAGVDGVALVRAGAAVSGLVASLGLFALLAPAGAARAGLAVVVLQLLPGAFDPYSFGNLSNVFGQSMTTLFFCWWAGPGSAQRSRPESERGFTARERRSSGGWPTGAVLLALGCLGHFSSFVVLVSLLIALSAVRGREGPGRVRLMAAAGGLGLAALYYARFAPLILGQVPRMFEGGGQGRGASRGTLDVLRLQLLGIFGQWGLPALALAIIGRPSWRASPLDRDLVAYGAAGAALALPAMLTPLDVRYLYALTVPLAAAAGAGLVKLRERGAGGALAAALLLGAQAAWGLRGLVEAIVFRYRG